MAVTLSNLAWLARCRGDWEEARTQADRGMDLMRSAGDRGQVFPLIQLGELALWEGDWEEASRLLEECIAVAAPQNDLQILRSAHGVLARRDLLEGHPGAALGRLEPLLDRPGLEEHDVTSLLPTLAWAHLARGAGQEDLQRAEGLAAEAVRRATAQQNRLALAEALRVQGMVLARQGQWEKAERSFGEAVSLAGSMPYPYAEAWALYEWGMMHAARGDREKARNRLREALEFFRRLGARKDVERTEHALERLAGA
ncbi:MAG: tetratricopeptide repeat protein [Chloroflexi bacterium]|nr:tetratricopeptide repeat protein [Chloroflexota bacterium]